MRSRTALAALLALTAAAGFLRFRGIRYGAPGVKEPDTNIVNHLAAARRGERTLDRDLSSTQYPHLMVGTALAVFGSREEPAPRSSSVEEHLSRAARPYVRVRAVSAGLSTFIVPATYLIARAFFPPAWSLFAAALPAGSLLHVNFAHQARPHAAASALMAVALAAALHLRKKPTATSYAIGGLAGALALGCLHSGAAALFPLASAHLVRAGRRRILDPRALIPVAFVLAAIPLFYAAYFDRELMRRAFEQNTLHEVMIFSGSGFARVARVLVSWEPVLALLLALAAATALVRGRGAWRRLAKEQRADVAVVLSFALPYLLVIGAFGNTFERFVTPLLPSFALGATGLVRAAVGGLRTPRGRAVAAVASVALLALSSSAAWKLSRLRAARGTLEEAADWLQGRARPGVDRIYVTPPIDLPLARTRESLEARADRQPILHSPWARYQAALPPGEEPDPRFSVEWMDARTGTGNLENDSDLAAYVDFYGPGWFVLDMERERKHAWFTRLFERIGAVGTRVARFSPDEDPETPVFSFPEQDRPHDDWPNVTWRILNARATGPVLEIHRILAGDALRVGWAEPDRSPPGGDQASR